MKSLDEDLEWKSLNQLQALLNVDETVLFDKQKIHKEDLNSAQSKNSNVSIICDGPSSPVTLWIHNSREPPIIAAIKYGLLITLAAQCRYNIIEEEDNTGYKS